MLVNALIKVTLWLPYRKSHTGVLSTVVWCHTPCRSGSEHAFQYSLSCCSHFNCHKASEKECFKATADGNMISNLKSLSLKIRIRSDCQNSGFLYKTTSQTDMWGRWSFWPVQTILWVHHPNLETGHPNVHACLTMLLHCWPWKVSRWVFGMGDPEPQQANGGAPGFLTLKWHTHTKKLD